MNNHINISERTRTGIFATLVSGMFISAMATTVTANMIPNFSAYFNVSENLAQWLTSGATLVSGIVIPITAFLIKRVPNKVYFYAAMLSYTMGSLFVCTANTFFILLIFRLVQALGCGMMIPFVQVILLNLYPTKRHGRVMAYYSMASMVSSVVGPTYAGLMLESFGFRGVFASLFIFGIIILIMGTVFVKNVIPKADAKINIGYVVLSGAGFVALILGVNSLSSGLTFISGGIIAAGILLLAIFSVLQLKNSNPMLNLNVFKEFTFRISVIISICLYLISMGTAMLFPILTKTICGYSDSSYGYATLIGAILAIFCTLYAGRIYDKAGIKPMFIAGIIFYALYCVLGFNSQENTGIIYIAFAYALQNIAMSVLNSPATTMALSRLNGSMRIDGSAVLNTIRQISSSLASTVTVLIYTLAGTGINAVHVVFTYYAIVTAVILIALIVYLAFIRKSKYSTSGFFK